jgi:hypothetical protein
MNAPYPLQWYGFPVHVNPDTHHPEYPSVLGGIDRWLVLEETPLIIKYRDVVPS